MRSLNNVCVLLFYLVLLKINEIILFKKDLNINNFLDKKDIYFIWENINYFDFVKN